MTEEKKPAAPTGKAAQGGTKEKEAENKGPITLLQDEITQTQKEIRILEGLINNRKPEEAKELKGENEVLAARVKNLEKALLFLMLDSFHIKQSQESTQNYESMRVATVDFMKKSGVDSALWKSIAS